MDTLAKLVIRLTDHITANIIVGKQWSISTPDGKVIKKLLIKNICTYP